ncbi:MAG: AI-2E family transporter [Phycisphaerae bacterium]|nr:AI-2E family transporter [Phycisphaerae bacterium]
MIEQYVPKLSESTRRWVRFAGLLVVLGLLCWIAYGLRTVFTPLLAALAIAYILNPVVTWFETRRRIPRLTTVIVSFALLGAVVLGGGLYLGAKTVAQIQQFSLNLPTYRQKVEEWIKARTASDEITPATLPTSASAGVPATSAPASAPAATSGAAPRAARQDDWWKRVTPLLEKHGASVASSTANYFLGVVSSFANLVTLLLLIPTYTFFFLWRFNDIVRTIHDHLPAAYRSGIVHAAQTIDGAVANFFRGRLIVCLIVGTLTGIGWSFVPGQHYALPLGVLAGALNLVPFMSLLALPPALLFAYLGASDAGGSWVWPVCLTMAVYLAVQALESFLLSPAIEGKSSGLHPLAIVVALLIGAQLAGLLGMLLAIPIASTLKTFTVELVLPEIRRLAGHPAAEPPEPIGDDSDRESSAQKAPEPKSARKNTPADND